MLPDPKELELIIEKNPEEAIKIVGAELDQNFDDPTALFYMGYIFLSAEKFGLAFNMFARAAQFRSNFHGVFSNMGLCFQHPHMEKAKKFFERAIELDPNNYTALGNMGLVELELGNPEKSIEWCNKALEVEPNAIGARSNRGLAYLALHQWKEGWIDYEYGAGGKWRRKRDYGVPDWDGKAKGTVIVYGEQGLGDEIIFASCIPDLQKTNDVIIDTAPRLDSLFSRSFDCPAYDTRYDESTPLIDNHIFDYQISVAALPKFYRNKTEDFPGTPWIKADPERRTQWRALLDTLPGKKIGLAWSGGLSETNRSARSFDLATFKPLLDENHTFISLEYKDVDKDELASYNIKHWDRAVKKGVDYDETMALIAELDLIISVPTTVVHGAGSVGVPCWVLVPSNPGYRWYTDPNPWHKSVIQIRQNKDEAWDDVIQRVKQKLTKEFLNE